MAFPAPWNCPAKLVRGRPRRTDRESAIEDEIPAAGHVIVQCMDEIDEMQRWLEGRA